MGFADTRAEARQLVRHGHFTVNGKRVNIPSFAVKPGTPSRWRRRARRCSASPRRSRRWTAAACRSGSSSTRRRFKGTVKTVPNREDLTMPIQEQLIVELYSK